MKKLLVLPLILLLSVSCNELRKDTAKKDGIKLLQGQTFAANYKANPTPDSMTMFLWPTEDFYNRYKAEGLVDQRDYQSFVADVAAEVFLAGDEFDEWTIEQLTTGKDLKNEVEEIQTSIDDISDEWKELKAAARDLSKKYRKQCKRTPDSEECVAMKADLDEAMAKYNEVDAERKELISNRDKKQKKIDDIVLNQSQRVARVQAALDPQATVWRTDDENRRVVDSVKEDQQVNWVKLYSNYVGEKNSFDIKDGYIDIEFGEFGINAVGYKTVYLKDDSGNVQFNVDGSAKMAKESDFSKMIYLGRNVYEFHMLEKDTNGNRTGRIYEFKLEKSPFDIHMKVLGDVVIKYNGAVERRGQIKIVLTKAE